MVSSVMVSWNIISRQLLSALLQRSMVRGQRSMAVSVPADIDECATQTDNCDLNAECTNTDGSFDCTCVFGYDGDGVDCSKWL